MLKTNSFHIQICFKSFQQNNFKLEKDENRPTDICFIPRKLINNENRRIQENHFSYFILFLNYDGK